ncbi:histidine kinase [Streptomyces sp. 150FB]|uniref:sensor histidine kinase n=1 Tax=Streptomyces sp. 150FB TaxID=1576605 RepID=UPI00191C58FC|nr:histidine kinase [Streptomyces sp. 150FB]
MPNLIATTKAGDVAGPGRGPTAAVTRAAAEVRRRVGSLPPRARDVLLILCVLVAQLWPFLADFHPAGGPWHWWGYVVVVGSALPLLLRARFPVAVLLISLATTASYDLAEHVPSQPVWYAGLIAVHGVADRSGPRARVTMLVVTVGGSLLARSPETALRSTVMFVAAYALGRAAATSRSYTRALRERAARLERDRVVEAQRAAERERARIARDMHDILSHAVALMVVQAEAGPVVAVADPARVEGVFDTIADTGRDAMLQLRRILTVLSDDDGARTPRRTLADLPALAERACGPALRVTYAATGRPRPVAPDTEIAVFHIAQEAVTNIVKHSEAAHADIRLHWGQGTLVIEIEDDGRGGGPALPGTGHGLIGMRERTAASNGTMSAGPREDGAGFVVRAELPLARAADGERA